jgi:hypothetical protein
MEEEGRHPQKKRMDFGGVKFKCPELPAISACPAVNDHTHPQRSVLSMDGHPSVT